MKLFTKTSTALLLITIFIVSCKNGSNVEKTDIQSPLQEPDSPSRVLRNNPVILILGSNPDNGKLLLSDGDRSFTHRNGIVKWVNLPFSGVKEIKAIYPKINGTPEGDTDIIPNECNEIFKEGDPKQSENTLAQQFDAIWVGHVDPAKISGHQRVIYCYSIDWTDENGIQHTFDPEIEVNEFYEE